MRARNSYRASLRSNEMHQIGYTRGPIASYFQAAAPSF
jgi:hypothetical protein